MRDCLPHRTLRLLPLALAIAAAMPAHADSGVGVDTWRANRLHPDAGVSIGAPDERGTSWLAPGQRRTPSGNLYQCPIEPAATRERGDWIGHGVLEVGAIATSGDDHNAQWNRYVDWDGGLILGLLDYTLERPDDGRYANVRASRISDDDEYYQAVFGRAGSFKVQAFLRDMPNVLSDDAKSIWNGVGGNELTLVAPLVPAGSTPAEVAAAHAAAPTRTLSVTREKQGIGFSLFLTPRWTLYANATNEDRKGARPFGGTFFFNFPFPGNGGIFETLRPIDDSTVNLNGGLRFAGPVWRMDLGYVGSFYRDAHTRFTYETPYALYPVVPGAVSAPLTTGQFATEPDNDYHNLKATFTRKLPLNGELSLTASGGRMRQDDDLIAPIACQGVFGIGLDGSLALGPHNPFLFDCADWNTPDALSRRSADMQIDTSLFDGRIVLQPSGDLTLRGSLRWNREDYRDTYLAFNPRTGQYGYVSENGAQGSVVPGEIGFWDPFGNASNVTRVRSLALDLETTEATFATDWKLGTHDTLGATYTFNRFEPTHRERREVDAHGLKLTWVNRALDWLTFRANYAWLTQDGDRYNHDPYEHTFSMSLPGFIAPPGGVLAHTVDALRKYDVSSRDQHKLDLMATFTPRADMTLGASLRGEWNEYDAELGRQGYDTLGLTLQWEWQPSPRTSASVYYGYDRSRLDIANINDLENGDDPTLGGATYPLEGRWWVNDEQRNHNAGATLRHAFGKVRFDAGWNSLHSRGITRYRFASPVALAYFSDGALGIDRFPPMSWRVNALDIGVTFPLHERVSLRLFDYYERASIRDWHYDGFDRVRVIDHRVYADGGPDSYDANMVGLLLRVAL